MYRQPIVLKAAYISIAGNSIGPFSCRVLRLWIRGSYKKILLNTLNRIFI
jgi:hypothetical protein